MTCDHPDCTGVHQLSRWNEICPAARERKRERDSLPTYKAKTAERKRTPRYRSSEMDRDAVRVHGFAGRAQYDEYLARGCAVEGCERKAEVVDHDHLVCPQSHHSCDLCRRGPLCQSHNTKVIAAIDKLRAGGLQAELRYLGLSVTFTQLATEAA